MAVFTTNLFSISAQSFRRESRQLLRLTLPIFLAQLALTALGVVDTLMSAWSGTEDLAAIGLGSSIMLPVFIFATGILLAIPPLVAKAHGRGQGALVGLYLSQGALLAVPIGLVCALFLANMQPVLDLLKLEPLVYQLSEDYLWYVAFGMPAIALYQALRFYWEGLGQTLPTMWISFAALLLNIPLNALFIYGGFGLEPMGAAGCGVATAIVMWLMLVFALLYIHLNPFCKQFVAWHKLAPRYLKAGWQPILAIGLPNALALLFEVSLFTLIALFVAPLGANIIAAQQIAISVTSVAFMLPLSLGMALTVRIGQVYGQGDQQRLREVLQTGFFYAVLIGIFLSVLTLMLRAELVGLYSDAPEVVTVALGLLILAALYQISDALQVATAGILRGFHDTRITMWVTFLSYWLIGLGGGYLLSFTDWLVEPLGVYGFWIGICVGLAMAALLLVWRLRVRLPSIQAEMQQCHSANV